MNVMIHDLENQDLEFLDYKDPDLFIFSALEKTARCHGCFGCWLHTPGICVMGDKLQLAGARISNANQIIIISQCLYGGFSIGVKRILDRGISGVLPFFSKRNGKMHHSKRYSNNPQLRVIFYGEYSLEEQELGQKIAQAYGINFAVSSCKVDFVPNKKLIGEFI